MKLRIYLTQILVLFLAAQTTLQAIDYSVETVSAEQIKNNERYRNLNSEDPEHHLSMVRIHGLPKEQNYFSVVIDRPALKAKEAKMTFKTSKEVLLENAHKIGENIPFLSIGGRGYLPGEPIAVTFDIPQPKSRKGSSKNNYIKLIPNPLMTTNADSAIISAELFNVNPTMYNVTIDGFQPNEKLNFTSISANESGGMDLTFTQMIVMNYMPGVVGKSGGSSHIIITRQNGEMLKLELPWGNELFRHLKGEMGPATLDFPTLKQ